MIILMLLKTLSKKKNVDLNLDWLKKYEVFLMINFKSVVKEIWKVFLMINFKSKYREIRMNN